MVGYPVHQKEQSSAAESPKIYPIDLSATVNPQKTSN